jgi:protein arginine phosphatase
LKRVLFVCTGNTCRSPMAEAILKSKKLDGVEVKSAGVYASNGSAASAHAKKVLDGNLIDHDHQSSLLTSAQLEWADVVLTMTLSHKMAITSQFSQFASKVFTLKELVGETYDLDVVDPYGGSLDIYQETYQELDKLITKAIEKW